MRNYYINWCLCNLPGLLNSLTTTYNVVAFEVSPTKAQTAKCTLAGLGKLTLVLWALTPPQAHDWLRNCAQHVVRAWSVS